MNAPAGITRLPQLHWLALVKFVIDSGPKGMSVSPVGVVYWYVPRSFAESEVTVNLKATDASGKEIFQTFRLSVRSQAEGPELKR